MKTTLQKNIIKLITEKGLSHNKLAQLSGVHQPTITRIINGESKDPRRSNIDKLAKALGVDTLVLTGEQNNISSLLHSDYISDNIALYKNSKINSIEAWDSNTTLNENDVEVPFYMEVELSAGHGSTVQIERQGPKIRFSKLTLKRQGVSVENAACVKVTGNSMEPVIPDGATIGIDTAKTMIKDGDMYAIDWDGALFVKILTRKPGGGIRIKSFNSDEYPEEKLSAEESKNVRVIGRVFWYSVLM